MDRFMNITKALADESRVRILMALHRQGEMCVCQLIDMLQLAPSTVSKHLFILRNARLVCSRKEGRWMHYRLNDDGAYPEVAGVLAWMTRSLAESPRIQQDDARLKAVLADSPAEKCGG
jgi:DNA-binding transcriptional ArsR family regulator